MLRRFLDFINEAMKQKKMVRDGKVVKKWKTTRPGTHRIEYDENGKPREVRMSAEEIRNRERGQKVGKLKRDSKEKIIQARRAKSFKVRDRSSELEHYNQEFPDVNSEHDGTEK